MNNINWQNEFLSVLKNFNVNDNNGEKPKVLLHCCCAPCATVCIEKLKSIAEVTAYFYNPNMDNEEEYHKRANEMVKLADFMGVMSQ